jgi:hypothetical protein
MIGVISITSITSMIDVIASKSFDVFYKGGKSYA